MTFTDKAAGELKARLAALGVHGVRASTFHSAALRQLRHFAPGPGRPHPAVEGAPAPADREQPAARAVQVPRPRATSPPRSSGRRTGASAPDAYREEAADREPPIPLDLMHGDLPRVRGAQGGRRADRLRGPARADGDAVRARRRGLRHVPGALRRVHGRRVPGREPAAAGAARPVARRSRRPLRRRRRLPVDLRVHRRRPRASARCSRSASRTRRSCGSRRTTARRRRCSHSRTASSRISAARRRCCAAVRPDGPEPVVQPLRESRRTKAPRSSSASAASSAPLEEVAILARTNARLTDFEELLHDAGLPFQGAVAARARRRSPPDTAARAVRDAGGVDGARRGARGGLAAGSARQARRARGGATERPQAARGARGGVRRRRRGLRRRPADGASIRAAPMRAASTC